MSEYSPIEAAALEWAKAKLRLARAVLDEPAVIDEWKYAVFHIELKLLRLCMPELAKQGIKRPRRGGKLRGTSQDVPFERASSVDCSNKKEGNI